MMKKLLFWLNILCVTLMVSGCGPTVQDYSDALQGTWVTPLEFTEDGGIETGNVYLTFSPITDGSKSSQLKALYRAHFDYSTTGYTADCTISVKGSYTIDDVDEEHPLDMDWDIKSLDVNVSNIEFSNVVDDFQASLEEVSAAFFGINGGSRSAFKNELTKQVKSNCRRELIERNNDNGWYGLEFEEDSFFLILSNDTYKFTRAKRIPSNSD